jgi:hypothetical protein
MQTTRRVRHDVADAVLLMGFSLGASVAAAVGIALLSRLG